MAIIRWLLGSLILFFNWLFTPKTVKRETHIQAAIDKQTSGLILYQYKACPFCVKVRRVMKRKGLNIETRDVKRSVSAKDELLSGGGDLKVPCLRVNEGPDEVIWVYESGKIIDYLEGRCIAQEYVTDSA